MFIPPTPDQYESELALAMIAAIPRMHEIMMALEHPRAMIEDFRGAPRAADVCIRTWAYIQSNFAKHEREYERGLLTDVEWMELQLQAEMVSAAAAALGL